MPQSTRSLTRQSVEQAVVDALRGDPDQQRCGIEIEWPVHRHEHVELRPGMGRLTSVTTDDLPARGRATIEPGGQLELSTAPVATIDQALIAAELDARELHRRLHAVGLVASELAVDTRRAPHRMVERARYAAMERFFDAEGDAGRWMMCNTAALQVNVSHARRDPDLRWRVAHRVGPVLTAAFANSPGFDRAGRRWESLRQAIWWSINPSRTRCPRIGPPMHQAWAEYALTADVMFIRGDEGAAALPPGFSFARWLAEGHSLGHPSLADLQHHLTTLFPPVRTRGWLELRMIDALPVRTRDIASLVALTALTTDAAEELLERLPRTERLWCPAARFGLGHPALARAADILFEVVQSGLPQATAIASRRDAVAEYVDRYVARRRSPAQLVGDVDLRAEHAPRLTTGPDWHETAA